MDFDTKGDTTQIEFTTACIRILIMQRCYVFVSFQGSKANKEQRMFSAYFVLLHTIWLWKSGLSFTEIMSVLLFIYLFIF